MRHVGKAFRGLRSFVGFQDLAALARRYRCDLVWFNTLFPRNRQNDKPTEGALLNGRNTFRIILEATRQVGLVLVVQLAIASSVRRSARAVSARLLTPLI